MTGKHPIELFFSDAHPITAYVDPQFTELDGGTIGFEMDAPAHFIRGEADGTLHTGFVTIVLDSVMGGAVMGVMEKLQPIATVGLSVHHLRRPVSGERLRGRAVCTGIYSDLAYVTGQVTNADGSETLALASGTFMIGTRATPIGERTGESRI